MNKKRLPFLEEARWYEHTYFFLIILWIRFQAIKYGSSLSLSKNCNCSLSVVVFFEHWHFLKIIRWLNGLPEMGGELLSFCFTRCSRLEWCHTYHSEHFELKCASKQFTDVIKYKIKVELEDKCTYYAAIISFMQNSKS